MAKHLANCLFVLATHFSPATLKWSLQSLTRVPGLTFPCRGVEKEGGGGEVATTVMGWAFCFPCLKGELALVGHYESA